MVVGGAACSGRAMWCSYARHEAKRSTSPCALGRSNSCGKREGGGAAVAATAITKDEQADVASSSRDSKQVPGAPTPRARPGLGSGRVREK